MPTIKIQEAAGGGGGGGSVDPNKKRVEGGFGGGGGGSGEGGGDGGATRAPASFYSCESLPKGAYFCLRRQRGRRRRQRGVTLMWAGLWCSPTAAIYDLDCCRPGCWRKESLF